LQDIPWLFATKAMDHRILRLGLTSLPRVQELPQRPKASGHIKTLQHFLIEEQQEDTKPWTLKLRCALQHRLFEHKLSKGTDPDCDQLEELLAQASQEVAECIPHSEHTRKPWISEDTWRLMLARRPLVSKRMSLEKEARDFLKKIKWQGP
jgi:hypothetical protein